MEKLKVRNHIVVASFLTLASRNCQGTTTKAFHFLNFQ